MRYLKVSVGRMSYTDIYVEVPDEFKAEEIFKNKYLEQLQKITIETTTRDDWDYYEWEKTLEILGGGWVDKEEAESFMVGQL